MKRKNKPLLGIENARVLHAKLDWEGDMLYVAQNWTFKEEFKDKKYESLRKALVKAAADLDDYCALYRVDDEVEEDAPEEEPDDAETCDRCGDALNKNGGCDTCADVKH